YVESEPKTEKSRRSILLAPLTVEILKQHRVRQLEAKLQAGEAWQDSNLVFCTAFGTPLNPNKVLERFKTLLKRAGLPDIRFHDSELHVELEFSVGIFSRIICPAGCPSQIGSQIVCKSTPSISCKSGGFRFGSSPTSNACQRSCNIRITRSLGGQYILL